MNRGYKNSGLTKSTLLNAFDKSESKSVADLCRIARVSRYAFYYHLNRDADFRRELITKQREHLTERLAVI